MDEFSLIQEFFARQPVRRDDCVLGIGDDAAAVRPPADRELVVTQDVLVAGVHFPQHTASRDIGHKALAVNLSDLAAMGAEPAWAVLGIALPEPDREWLGGFCDGLFALAAEHTVQLIGGDTVRGPLTVALTLHGMVPPGTALTRHGAAPGDGVYVTGSLGAAAMGLAYVQGRLGLGPTEANEAVARLNRPRPRIREGSALRDLASAAIDLSDGLAADLAHLCRASGVGARVEVESLPVSDAYRAHFEALDGWAAAVAGGDDYELCFTVPPDKEAAVTEMARQWACGIARIGRIEAAAGVNFVHAGGRAYTPPAAGYRHFAD